jgi:hypothetical protein
MVGTTGRGGQGGRPPHPPTPTPRTAWVCRAMPAIGPRQRTRGRSAPVPGPTDRPRPQSVSLGTLDGTRTHKNVRPGRRPGGPRPPQQPPRPPALPSRGSSLAPPPGTPLLPGRLRCRPRPALPRAQAPAPRACRRSRQGGRWWLSGCARAHWPLRWSCCPCPSLRAATARRGRPRSRPSTVPAGPTLLFRPMHISWRCMRA